jgi:hypothetical protein
MKTLTAKERSRQSLEAVSTIVENRKSQATLTVASCMRCALADSTLPFHSRKIQDSAPLQTCSVHAKHDPGLLPGSHRQESGSAIIAVRKRYTSNSSGGAENRTLQKTLPKGPLSRTETSRPRHELCIRTRCISTSKSSHSVRVTNLAPPSRRFRIYPPYTDRITIQTLPHSWSRIRSRTASVTSPYRQLAQIRDIPNITQGFSLPSPPLSQGQPRPSSWKLEVVWPRPLHQPPGKKQKQEQATQFFDDRGAQGPSFFGLENG